MNTWQNFRSRWSIPTGIDINVDRRIPVILFVVGLTLRIGIIFRGLPIVDRLFIPDDAYYTLSIARSLSMGIGPTADGVILTNGFQPLLAFLIAPSFWLGGSQELPLLLTLVLSAIVDSISALLLGRIANRSAGNLAGIIAAGLWSLSPLAISNALNGLETSLALVLQLAVLEGWWAARKGGIFRHILWGGLAALSLLARVDSIFLVGILAIFEVYTVFCRQRRKRDFLSAGITGAVIVAPWWGYSLLRFGSVIPESGAAVIDIVNLHRSIYLNISKQIAWTSGSLLGPPLFEFREIRRFFLDTPEVGIVTLICLVVLFFLFIRKIIRNTPIDCSILIFSAHSLLIMMFYCFIVPALWFFRRYLCPVYALTALMIAIGIARSLKSSHHMVWRIAIVGILLLAGGRALFTYAHWAVGLLDDSDLDAGLDGAKGYFQAAQEVLKIVPEGAVLGSCQSGALSYLAPNTIRVVNLDGVVNKQARWAGEQGILLDYAYEQRISHLADWSFNMSNLGKLSLHAHYRARLRLLGSAHPQGTDQFSVFELGWEHLSRTKNDHDSSAIPLGMV